jgi:hypothetical protein
MRVVLSGIVVAGVAMVLASACSTSDGESGAGGNPGGDSGSSIDSSLDAGGGLDTGTGQDSDGFDPDAGCVGETVQAQLLRSNLLVVLDRSGSMNCNAPPTQSYEQCHKDPNPIDPAKPTKLDVTRDALLDAIQALEASRPLPSVGMLLFSSDGKCGVPAQPNVPVAPLSGNPAADKQLQAIQQVLGSAVAKGSTPMIAALESAWTAMRQQAAALEGNRFVVLLTDGAEMCQKQAKASAVQHAAEAAKEGIRTFVLGVPGSEPERAFLSQLAFGGGTPSAPNCNHAGDTADVGNCHMDMTLPNMDFPSELKKNLAAISGQAIACSLKIPAPPNGSELDYNLVNVVYASGQGVKRSLQRNDSKACSDPSNQGWQYADNNTRIELCAGACATVRADETATVSIVLGCKTNEAPK